MEELTAALKDTKKEKAALERKLKNKAAEVETLNAEKAALRKDVTKIEEEKKDLEARLDTLSTMYCRAGPTMGR